MNYVKIYIEFNEINPWREIVLSQLAEEGFESFVDTEKGLECYISEKEFNENLLQILKDYDHYISHTQKEIIKEQNWNQEWEKNFPPVFVEDDIVIKAPFHLDVFHHKIQITIQPQMSFGTGHHQTTWLMCQRIFKMDFKNKSVLDMGTGTGVLAILAEKLGADSVFATDIDEWSYQNVIENIGLNQCEKIKVALGDIDLIQEKNFDIIIANINKNVLLSHLQQYFLSLQKEGFLLLSGFFSTDIEDLKNEALKIGFVFESFHAKDEWALLVFTKN